MDVINKRNDIKNQNKIKETPTKDNISGIGQGKKHSKKKHSKHSKRSKDSKHSKNSKDSEHSKNQKNDEHYSCRNCSKKFKYRKNYSEHVKNIACTKVIVPEELREDLQIQKAIANRGKVCQCGTMKEVLQPTNTIQRFVPSIGDMALFFLTHTFAL